METKLCPACNTVKSVASFYKANKRPDGLAYACKVCSGARTADWRAGNMDKTRATRRKASVKWQAANPDKLRCSALRRKYGITLEDYHVMLHAQGGVCGICASASPNNGKSVMFAVDHDHDTGAVRGLLCNTCNRGIGYLKDSPTILYKAYNYLRGNHNE